MEAFTLQTSNLVAQTIDTATNFSFSVPTDDDKSYALLGVSIIVLFVCLPLNGYVLQLIVINSSHGATSECFSLNLSVCEIIICFSAVPSVINIILYKNSQNSPLFLYLLLLSVLHSISRPFFQCCVCLERYIAVIHPVIFLKYKSLIHCTGWSVVSWVIIVGLSVFSIFLPYRNTLYYILLPEYFLIFSITILCSIAVLKALRKPGPGEKLSAKDAESNRTKKKAFWVIMIILVFMVITYCPMMLLIFVFDFISETQKWCSLTVFFYFMTVAGFAHQFLYLHRVRKLPSISWLKLMVLFKLK